jgi:hypothetical protein
VLVQLETFVAHLLKCSKAPCRNFFLLLAEGIVYQVLEAVPLEYSQAQLIVHCTLNP